MKMGRALARLAPAVLAVLLGGVSGARAAAPMLFRDGCMPVALPTDRIVMAGVGDLLFHEPLQRQALTPETDYAGYFAAVAPVLTGADITYGNLEGPAAHGVVQGGKDWKDPGRVYDGKVYGTAKGALIFNYHPSVIGALKAAGFSVVSTANNHAADRRALGIDRTIDALTAAGLPHTGTRRRFSGPVGQPSGELAGQWSTTVEANGMRVAWLACTFGTNSLPDPHGQVLQCYQHRDVVMAELARLAADPTVSAVVLTPHWGDEGATKPKPSDRLYARAAIEAGATAVIGTHPHVLQPWEQIETSDGRQGLVIYSTGNFLSNQHTTAQRSGIIALLELTRDPASGKVRLSAAGFVPTWVEKQSERGHRIVEQVDGGHYVGVPAPGAKPRRAAKTARLPVPEDGLAATLRLLPDNRVAMASFRDLPRRECPAIAPPAAPDPSSVSMVVADATTNTPPSFTLRHVAGAISFAVAALPRLPVPIPASRADPVLRTRRPSRAAEVPGYQLTALDADKTRSFATCAPRVDKSVGTVQQSGATLPVATLAEVPPSEPSPVALPVLPETLPGESQAVTPSSKAPDSRQPDSKELRKAKARNSKGRRNKRRPKLSGFNGGCFSGGSFNDG
jgi:Bacterial capsule synthesis protein PGA_cap